MTNDFLYGISEGWLALFIILIFAIFAEIGFRFGRKLSVDLGKEVSSHVATIEGALLGLLALLLGFAFSMAMARYEARRAIVVNEANDLQTTFLQAQLLTKTRFEVIAPLLRDYVDSRIRYYQAGFDSTQVEKSLSQTTLLQTQLWEQALLAAEENHNAVTTGIFIQSLNSLLDDHTNRIAAMDNHVPEIILFLLIFVGSMSLAMTGYNSGLNATRLMLPRSVLIVLIAATLTVIIDLDRPRRGFITVSERAFLQLREDLKVK